MSAGGRRRARRGTTMLGFERLLLAGLLALFAAACSRGGTPPAKIGGSTVALSPAERELVSAWQADRGLSEGDAISNVMLRRYQEAGHKVRYAGDGLYEVLDRPGGKAVVATFFVKAPSEPAGN